MYLIIEATSKESTKAGPYLAVHVNNKCDLDLISLINKDKVVVGLECEQDLTEISVTKVMLRHMFLNKSFFSQYCLYPL